MCAPRRVTVPGDSRRFSDSRQQSWGATIIRRQLVIPNLSILPIGVHHGRRASCRRFKDMRLTKPRGRQIVVESPREQSVCRERVGHGHRPLHAGHPSRSQEPRPLLEQERCLRRQETMGRRAQGCRRRTSSHSHCGETKKAVLSLLVSALDSASR